tara:strand:+ start:2850 stop:3560 length:711 start_codon:yes stop_codon:yes gene_type:complete
MATTKATTLGHQTIPTSAITSGTFADARIASSNVTQHEGLIDALANNPTVTLHATGDSGATNTTFPQGHIIKSQSQKINLAGGTQIQNTTETDFNYDSGNSTSAILFTPKQETTNLIVTLQLCMRHDATWQSQLMRCYYKVGSGSWNQFFIQGRACYVEGTNVSDGMFMEARTSTRHPSGFSRGTDQVSIKWTLETHYSGNWFCVNSYNIDNSVNDLNGTQISQFGGLITISEEKL